MTLDEFLQAFCKAIMDILPTDDLMRVYKCLEPTVKAEVAAFNAASKGEKFSDGWNDLFEKTLDNFSDAVKFSLEEQARKKSNENEYAKATPGSATTEDRLVQSLLNNPIDKEACAVGSIYDKSRIPITVTVDDGEGNQIDFESDDETMRTAFDNIVGPEELWRCMQSALTAEKLQNACWQLIEHLMDAYETGQKAVKLLTSLPKIPKINGLSILKFIGEQIREMIIALVTQVIIMIVQEVLESIKEACKPKPEVEEFYGGADVKQFIPPGAAEKAFGDLKLPPNIFDDLSELMDDLSVMMLPSELCTLLNGDPSPDTKKIVRDLLEEKYPNLELKCGVNIEDLLDRIGLYVPVEMCDEISQNAFEPPSLFGLLCETDAPMVHFRHKLLSGKMNAEEVKQQLNQRKREQQEKLRKYTDMMAKGNPLEDLLPEILSSCGLDGSTAGTGIIPRDIPSVSYSVDKVTSSQFSMVEAIFNKDMLAFPNKIINESFIEPDKGSVSNPEDPIFEVAARIAETTRSDWDEADENGKLQILKEVMAANGMVKMSQGVLPGYKNIVADPARVNKYLGSMLQDNQGTIDTDYLDHTARYKFSVPAIKAFDLTPPKALQKLQKKVAYYRGLITEFKASKLDIETIPPKERTKQQKRALKNIKEGLGDVKDNFKETKQKAEEHLAAYKEQRANPANFKETVPAAKPHYPIDWEIISKAKADVEPFAEFALRITDLNDDLVLEHTISEPFKNIDATENFDFTEDGSTFQAASFANLLYNSFASGPAGAKNPKKFQLKEVGSLDSPLEDVFANLPMPPEVEEELTLPVHPFKTPIVTEYFKKYVFHSAYSGRMKFALKEMAQSPLLDARTLQSIRLTPSAEDTSCPPSQTGNKVGILNVESLKNSARDIFDKSCHSMLDMGEALDKANSIAFVYLTIRVFALEELMKSIFVFTQLNMKDIMEDNIIAEYFSLIIGDKIAKSNLTAPSGMGYKSKSNNNIDNPSTFSQEELLVDIMKERKKVQETIEDPYTGEILYQKKTVEQTLYHAMNIDQLSDTTSIIKFLVKEQIKDLAVGIDSAFDQAIKTHRKNPYESLIDFVVDVPLNAYSPRLWRSPVPVPVGDGNEETLYNTVFPGSLKLAYEGGFLVERFIRVTDHSEDFLKGALADDVLLTDMYAEAVLYRNGGPGNPYGCKGIDCVREDGLAVNTDIESESNDIYSGIGEEFEIPAHLGGVVNIDAFGKWLSINEYLLGGNIGKQASQYFSNVEYGIRLVYLPALMPEIDPPTWQQAHAQTRFMQYLKGWPGPGANDEMWDLNAVPFDISFGPNNEFEIPNPEVVAFEKAYALMEDVNLLKSDTPPSVPIAPWVHTIPLIEYAMPIEISTAGGNKAFKDMTIGELRLAMDSIIKSEIEDDPLSSIGPVNFNVLLQELINTPEYRLLVEDIFSVGKHSSLSMIYSTTLVSKLAPEVENCFAATKDASRLLLHAMQTEG
ncbi:MAG TPA: hypothetical protein DEP37_05915, partial [Algoriphagus sp.]|nr:hypothetical protein [Algoriphagus sp.]